MARATNPTGAGWRLTLGGLLLGFCLWPLPGCASEIDHIMASVVTMLAGLVGLITALAALILLVVVVCTPPEKRRTGPAWLVGLALVSMLCLNRIGLLQSLTSGWREPQDEPHPFGLVLPNRRPLPSPAVFAEISRASSADTMQPAQVYTYVEVMPYLAGGDTAATRLVRQTMRYPAAARLRQTKGLVYVSFLVGTRGEVLNPHVVKRIGDGCDEEALRVLTALPPFAPGKQGSQPVVVQLLWAFYFCLPEQEMAPRQ